MAAVLERPNVLEQTDALARRMTPEEYLAWERDPARINERRSEYIYGEVIEMPGASREHNLINVAVTTLLSNQLDNGVEIYSNDMRVRVGSGNAYVYPDAVVAIDEPQLLDVQFDTLLNPSVVVEILSPSTSDYDRGTKFELYQEIGSLTDYLMIAQDEPRIDHYARVDENEWLLKTYRSLDAVVAVDSLDCTLTLTEVYARIKF